MQKALSVLVLACSLLFASTLFADQIPFSNRTDVNQFIDQMVKKHQFKKEELVSLFDQVDIKPSIIKTISRPAESKDWAFYKKLFITDKRTQLGVEFWQKHEDLLAKAEKTFNVPAEIIVAILGVETFYGKQQGSHRVIDALSTLAFNYPKRAPFFTKELEQFLLLAREHKLDPLSFKGSYAGAIGAPQFIPSSYRHYAVTLEQKGPVDLRQNTSDIIASVANYFKAHGWKMGDPIVDAANTQGKQYKQLNQNTRTANYSVKQLEKAGIKVNDSKKLAGKVGLVELNPDSAPEVWVTHPNFYVITRYNTSKLYAMAVYELSEQLKQARQQSQLAKKQSNSTVAES